MDVGNRNGQMEQYMMASGSITKPKEKENSPIQMETIMMESGKMIKPMDMEFLFITKQGPDMRDIGKMTCSMAQEFKFIVTETDTKECSNKAEEMDKALIIILQDKYIKEDGPMEELKVLEYVIGQMKKDMKDSGKTIKNTDKVFIIGLMDVFIKVIIVMIKNMDMALMYGQMAGSI